MSRPHFAPAVSYSVAPTRLLALALGLSWFFSAAGLTALGLALVRTGQPNLPWQVLALVLGVTVYTAAFTVSTTRRYAHDTRIAAEKWLAANLAPNETLGVYGWPHYFGIVHGESRYRIQPEAALGKPVGSDERNEKSSIVRFLGLSGANDLMNQRRSDALQLIKKLPGNRDFFEKFLDFLITIVPN